MPVLGRARREQGSHHAPFRVVVSVGLQHRRTRAGSASAASIVASWAQRLREIGIAEMQFEAVRDGHFTSGRLFWARDGVLFRDPGRAVPPPRPSRRESTTSTAAPPRAPPAHRQRRAVDAGRPLPRPAGPPRARRRRLVRALAAGRGSREKRSRAERFVRHPLAARGRARDQAAAGVACPRSAGWPLRPSRRRSPPATRSAGGGRRRRGRRRTRSAAARRCGRRRSRAGSADERRSPSGGLIGFGGSPATTLRRRARFSRGSGIGIASSSAAVYGWIGLA